MGKGDKKTRRGKIVMGSYGKKRPGRNGQKNLSAVTTTEVDKKKKGE